MNRKTTLGGKRLPSTLVRPQYAPGLLLNDDDLTQAVDYTRDLNRLLLRALLGCGVICGLVVAGEDVCGKLVVSVGGGTALDCHGDPIHLPGKGLQVTLDPACGVEIPKRVWVLIHRRARQCAPRSAVCAPDDDDAASVSTRIRDEVEVSVVSAVPSGSCGHVAATDPTADTDPNIDPDSAAAAAGQDGGAGEERPVQYRDHYAGICSDCCDPDCDCAGVLLAQLDLLADGTWRADHRVRRFIRPALVDDPQVAIEQAGEDTSPQ